MSKRAETVPLLVAAFGTVWLAALMVAYFIAGFAINSDAFWSFGPLGVMVLVIAPFALYAAARDSL